MKSIIGQNIKNIRTAKGLTQKELARKMNMSQNTVSQHENGIRGLSEKDINAYAKSLNVPLIRLVM